MNNACPICYGGESVIKNNCKLCGGSGEVTKEVYDDIEKELHEFEEKDEASKYFDNLFKSFGLIKKDENHSGRLIRTHIVPTGSISIMQGDHGLLEFVNLGDYGKERNIKADFLGLNRDINGVENGSIMSLEEKWVITLSTQYGCTQACKFCDVPLLKFRGNATYNDLKNQLILAVKQHPEITATKRLNIHFARMGEPTYNENILDFVQDLESIVKENTQLINFHLHPVLTTMLPYNLYENGKLLEYLNKWCDIKNNLFKGEAGLQLSLNSTDESQRDYLFSNGSVHLKDFLMICEELPKPRGRKYCLNVILSDKTIIDVNLLSKTVNKKNFMIKITPIHNTKSCKENNITTTDGYSNYLPYKDLERKLVAEGFDVLVFIPSAEEEEGLITCGNLILSKFKESEK